MARIIIHPGERLADELKALGMSANELAKELGVPTNRLTQIIRGKRGITGDTALHLGRWFGTGPDIWINLQCAAWMTRSRCILSKTSRSTILLMLQDKNGNLGA
jgi:addiction module HigA family antidote